MILAMIVIVIFGFLFYQLQESDIWSTPTFIILRWLLFIPVSLILLSFIFSTPNIVFNMIYDFAWWQIMLILIFAVGLLTMFFQATIYGGIALVLNLCPSEQVGSISTILLSILISSAYIYFVWVEGTLYAINYRSDFHSFCVTLFNLVLLGILVYNSINLDKGDY